MILDDWHLSGIFSITESSLVLPSTYPIHTAKVLTTFPTQE
jgi:hypothetical protein